MAQAQAQALAQAQAQVAAAQAVVAAAAAAQPQVNLVRRVVKSVLSGDYLVLRDKPCGGPPQEYSVSLAYIQAPRIVRSGTGADKTVTLEPWAWEAREYLCKRLIGQEVLFRSEFSAARASTAAGAPTTAASATAAGSTPARDSGLVYLGDENIAETMVREGWAEVRRGAAKSDSPIVQALTEAEEYAKANGKGKYSGQPAPKREILNEAPGGPASLKGKTFDGIVELVRNGGSLQVLLELEEQSKYLNVSIMVSGIRCPDNRKANETRYADEAKFFTESRMLNRDVRVTIEKVESKNTFLGSVYLGANNLAEHLLRQGMARCNDSSISLSKSYEKLRAAEREAKSKRLRIWENYVDTRAEGPAGESFEAKVVEVVSGDCLMLQNTVTGEIKKIFLASIRLGSPAERERQREAKFAAANAPSDAPLDSAPAAPAETAKQTAGKQQSGKQAAEAPATPALKSNVPRIYDNPILFHARELLRKKLLGKKAIVKVEYVQPKTDRFPEKLCCNVRPADQPKWNAAEALVSKGYASVIKYVSDDSQRASNFDELLRAEQNAMKSSATPASKKQASDLMAPIKLVDLTNDSARAKQLYPFLSRTRKEAVVEFVFSASKFKLFLAKENNTLLSLMLAGINVPRTPEALYAEATAMAKSLVHQRDVSIQLDNMDKKGNFIGRIFFKDDQGKETNLSWQLVKLGYAQVRETSISTGTLSELKAAETHARDNKLGLWAAHNQEQLNGHNKNENQENGVDSTANSAQNNKDLNDLVDGSELGATGGAAAGAAVTPEEASRLEAEQLKNRKPVIVTYAQSDDTYLKVYVQYVADGPKLEQLVRQLRTDIAAGNATGLKANYTPTARQEWVAARFSEDRQWYRARVEKIHSPSEIEVTYVDYGNREKVKPKDLIKLTGHTKYTSVEPFAKEFVLAFVEVSTHDQDWVDEARRHFMDFTTSSKMLLKVEYNDSNVRLDAVSLVDELTKTDVAKEMLEQGLLVVATGRRRERKLAKMMNEYAAAEKTARKNRANMWQYGDFTKDDAKEFGFRSVAA